MTALRRFLLPAAAALAVAACEKSETVDIVLDSEPFDITGEANAYSGLASIDPNSAGGDYTDNKDDIDDVNLKDLTLTIVSVNTVPTNGKPPNAATALATATFVVRDDVTQETYLYTVDPAKLPLGIVVDGHYPLGVVVPVPATDPPIDAFLTGILKAGHPFSVLASGATVGSPTNLTCRLNLAVDLELTVSWP